MHFSKIALGAAVGAGLANAQAQMSICDKYTTALLTNNTAANQYTLLTLLVNTVGLGNFTGPGTTNPKLPGSKVNVPGILAPGTYNGEAVNLLPYFDGSLKSTNRNGKAVSLNFLDGGGAAPIIANPLSSGTAGSNQYMLFTHLYQYFGALLGCSGYGTADFPGYMGQQSQQSVHMFMDLDTAQNSYFIEQVGLAAASFGVTQDDVATVATTLNNTFGYRCAPAVTVIPAGGPQYQSICQNVTCPIAANSSCGTAAAPVYPAMAPMSSMMSSSSMMGNMTSKTSSVAAVMTESAASSSASAAMSTGVGSATTGASMSGSATSGSAVASYTGAAVAVVAPGVLAGVAGLVAFAL